MTRVAGASGLTRVAIYKMLSGSGNPRLDSLVKLLQALGLGISVRPLKAA
ncbi:MAG: helix-turn-helix domain-containing transcriptional regulator [Panacagrimonas sp.]